MHETWMQLAIEQAQLGTGLTSPNPKVGAVIVKNDHVLGKGFHLKAGEPHAEPNALAHARSQYTEQEIQGASIYITLEPLSLIHI